MRYLIMVLLILNFALCQTDPIGDKRRKTDKYKLLALIGKNSEVKKTISVSSKKYNEYKIKDAYNDGTYLWTINDKRAEDSTFYFDLIRTQRDTGT